MTLSSQLFNKEPRWFANRPGLRPYLPVAVQSWVNELGSLTARLRGGHGGNVQVRVLRQQWGKPMLSERGLLKQPDWRYALIREVLLHSDGLPLLLARTVMPAKTLAAHGDLSRLGTRPLGEVLFTRPDLERWQMDVARVTQKIFTPSAVELAGIKQAIWGRRTVYALAGKEMLVCELFLPSVLPDGE